ncbi:MAG TPA: protein kinase, partial [Polyangiaceae bacterium]
GVDGVTRLTDFGIVRAEERIGNTRDGQLKGKLSYMAPEQTTSEPVDRRVDIFTAGIVLWECLASKRLFRGNTDAEVLRNLLDAPIPRLREVSPGYPQALDDVLARALRRDPDERFDNAAEFAEALEEAAEGLGIASPKAVGAYVRAFVGDAVDDVQSRVRAWMENPRRSQNPVAPVLAPGDDSKVRARGEAAGTGSAEGRPMPARYPSSPDTGTTHTRRPILIAVAAAGLVLIGAGVATTTLLLAAHNNPTPPLPAPTSAASIVPAQPATVTSSTSVTDLPTATTTAPQVHVGGPRVGPKPPPAPPPPHGSATAPTALVPPPTSSTFNPESM